MFWNGPLFRRWAPDGYNNGYMPPRKEPIISDRLALTALF